MGAVQPRESASRAEIYHALAEALAGPTAGIETLLLDAVTSGAQVLGSAACKHAALTLHESPDRSPEALAEGYDRATTRPGRRPVALYESLHCQGCLMGQSTRNVERRYRALGLSPTDGELPDHASVELAFLGHLAAAEAEARSAGDGRLVARLRAEQRHFMRSHAGAWLPDVGIALSTVDDPFYAAVGRLLNEFLSEELAGLSARAQAGRIRNRQAKAQLPGLKDPATCTLCGLCVGSCPLGALRVIESATETALTLNPSRCIGCHRCERICPEGVLHLSFNSRSDDRLTATNGPDHRVLRQSCRITCADCGRPTVSQAELDGVFARLQPDPATQQRLRLCVECKSWST